LLGYADSVVGHSPLFNDSIRQTLKEALASARAELGEVTWAAALAAGQALDAGGGHRRGARRNIRVIGRVWPCARQVTH
jgi:hypothetical protein